MQQWQWIINQILTLWTPVSTGVKEAVPMRPSQEKMTGGLESGPFRSALTELVKTSSSSILTENEVYMQTR